jgi:hypothetical protein
MNQEITQRKDYTSTFNKVFYALFVLISCYFLVRGEISEAMANLGIALVFDPFNMKTPFPVRPVYQKIWLIAHVAIVFSLLAIVISKVL